ncbi:MAG: hypothetical protein KF687_03030 [Cyclobacteriaceae bacterium]|nr:hypothetical protein [Cyclobacteriaceae bacterium]
MIRYIFAILLLLINLVCLAQSDSSRKFSVNELKEDVDFLFATLERIHPSLYHYTSKETILAKRTAVENSLTEPITRHEFAQRIIPLISTLNDGHTYLSFPQEELSEYLKNGGTVLPFDVSILNNKLFITSNYSSDSTIKLLTEIVSINNVNTPVLLNSIRPYLSTELESFRDIRIQRSIRSLLWNVMRFEGEFELELIHNGVGFNKTVSGITSEQFQAAISSQQKRAPAKPYSLYFTPENLAVINFRSMMDQKKFRHFLDSTFHAIRRNKSENLVVDIRYNGGGNSQLGDMLFNYITDKPYRQIDRMESKSSKEMKQYFRKRYVKWYMYPLIPVAVFHKQARFYFFAKPGNIQVIEMKKLHHPKNPTFKFNGNVFLLTSAYTFSSANMLANAFKCFEMGTLVGEETGGVLEAFGDVIPYKLPNTKLEGGCSYKKFVHPCYDGEIHGVRPDISILPTDDDVRQGRDAVLDYVRQTVRH